MSYVGNIIVKVLQKVFLPEKIISKFLGLHRLNIISNKHFISIIVVIFVITVIAFEDLYLIPRFFVGTTLKSDFHLS